jgi:hypothetical protein
MIYKDRNCQVCDIDHTYNRSTTTAHSPELPSQYCQNINPTCHDFSPYENAGSIDFIYTRSANLDFNTSPTFISYQNIKSISFQFMEVILFKN